MILKNALTIRVYLKGCQYNEPICSEGYKCNFFTGNCDVAKDESQMTLEEILKQREEEARQATLFQEQKEIINRDLYKKHYGETTIYRNNISITLNQIKEFLTPDGKRIKFDLSFKNLKDEKQAVSNLRIIANDGIAYVFYCPVLSSGLEPTQEISVNCTLDWVPRLTMISTIVREEDFGNLYLLYNYSDVIQPLEGFE